MPSPGITGTYAQLLTHSTRAITRRLRSRAARTLRALAVATCPCGGCS